MKNPTLLRILKHLENSKIKRELTEIHLTRFFTTVELDDGSVGACMSYYRLSDAVLDIVERRIQLTYSNPFEVGNADSFRGLIAEQVPSENQRDCLIASVTATVISALSAPAIRSGGDEWFVVDRHRPSNWTNGAESALVVGFGGFLEPLVFEERIKSVHVVDFSYDVMKNDWGARIDEWAAKNPAKRITGSRSLDPATRLRDFDLVSITGSTLCNGTLEYFLAHVRHDAVVILQGQSASLHPKVLFELGIKWIATTLKPQFLGRLAGRDHGGEEMRPLLQGGLPWIYLLPHQINMV
jgi:hypothetical protein